MLAASPVFYHSSIEDEGTSKVPAFNPEPFTAHCFKQFKRKDLCLPQSRRRVITVLGQGERSPTSPRPQPQAPPLPVPRSRALEPGGSQELQEDRKSWLNKTLRLKQELDTFGDLQKWLQNKANVTPLEAKVLHMVHREQAAQLEDPLTLSRAVKKEGLHISSRWTVPQLRLPRPSSLSVMFSYLHNRRIEILDVFNKADWNKHHKITREQFILALKAMRIPLMQHEVEDIVIYLGSLGKHSAITLEVLTSTYKRWCLTQQRSTVPTAKEYYLLARKRLLSQASLNKQKDSISLPPKMDLLTVPEVDIKTEARPLTLEEMEDVGKRYRERKRQQKQVIPAIQYAERCRLVRCGNQHIDDHCLPSTLSGEMRAILDKTRRDTFLVYLQCWKLCAIYSLPLTEDILMRALLYPGDKIVFQKDQIRPIRQPGGYYSDKKAFLWNQALDLAHGHELGSKMDKTDKLSTRPAFFLRLATCPLAVPSFSVSEVSCYAKHHPWHAC
ncbi:EF-hand calcium-binding domain-containing protein 12 isoform X1 [Ochotona princeps]|uniref:EF-hand calcium-binding domain-containing protein 12 isoform X1 n=1 Tax=Ochotona princeps TaxID=9978 RepID=UPI0027152E6D|nr:EF-hand calcium-binding domain-containing protein 12 isoform X1 [Ochotona princeps]